MSYLCSRFSKMRAYMEFVRLASAKMLAEIAQLVEHNLAKVGVAGSSPVFRSSQKEQNSGSAFLSLKVETKARMAELVDALVSGASVERRAGSSPVSGTRVTYQADKFSWLLLIKELQGNKPKQRPCAGGEIGIHATLRG